MVRYLTELFIRLLGLVNGLGLIIYGSKLLFTMTHRFVSADYTFTNFVSFLMAPPQLIVESIVLVGVLFILGLTFRIRRISIILAIIATVYCFVALVALAFGLWIHSGKFLLYLIGNALILDLLSLKRFQDFNRKAKV